jgi:GNAT superfamily N-acetyltransferase
MTLTPLTPARFEDFVELVRALAVYEHLDGPDEAAVERLRADAFASPPRYEAALALDDAGRAVGYAMWFETYSSFLARPTLYLEDLFVREDVRGRGVGSRLFDHVRALGASRGCGRMEWQVLDWNTPAREFYDRRRARTLPDWRTCRLTYTHA